MRALTELTSEALEAGLRRSLVLGASECPFCGEPFEPIPKEERELVQAYLSGPLKVPRCNCAHLAQEELERRLAASREEERRKKAVEGFLVDVEPRLRRASLSLLPPRLRREVQHLVEEISAARATDTPPEWAVFFGPVGAGKTFAAVALTKDLLGQGIARNAKYLKVEAWLLEARRTEWAKLKEELGRKVDLVVLDDLGLREQPSSEEARLLDLLFDFLWGWEKIVVATTNRSKEELCAYLGERAWDRMTDRWRPVVLTGKGGSRRGGKAAGDGQQS